ncbi:class I SAM-dependent DNA methyltransferase [Aurantiacibacter luteus]|uniref:site-specific DNA-methyltransferase (adenine-specific) n=1 Tax=Aurantiacibacter luteus TaxID=1581420 RepID=A0A0G9MYC3_9SPHN|nr:DNA methyltransferase [Aurantiacibacter luteus]KLE35777.1 methylase [Aurantiacibacter luteus]
MRLGYDELARRARAFSERHANSSDERADAQLFVNDLFKMFGLSSRQIGRYERRVSGLLNKERGFIDFFWPGQVLVEMKSLGKNLVAAEQQALEYIDGLHPTEKPRFVLVCDFQNWVLVDLEAKQELRFKLADLHKHVQAFDFMFGRRVTFERQEQVTIKAAELMGRIHDALEANNYTGHDLERFLVRLLFCMFADDTGIFQPKDIFLQLVENDTLPDGSNVGRVINELFEVLDTPEDERQANLSGELKQFPYVNGRLFRENLRTPIFDAQMREDLLDACRHDWAAVSPAIFGSLFQSVMDAKERRAKGAHYTSEENILKVIGPLFLDELREELETLKARKTAKEKSLLEFQARLSRMRFLDPACGCGNFLVIAYREVRQLELECLQELYGDQRIDAALLTRVTVDQFYGIEYEEFPAMIAEVAMWMADHIANNAINEAFRLNYARIPLTGGATIRHGDALEVDWNEVLPAEQCSFVMGNPPFIGHQWRTPEQQAGMHRVWGRTGQVNRLDYVTAWLKKAVVYGKANKRIEIAFVATNSISQGEQAGILWPALFADGIQISFAHRTFVWSNEASGKAAVHCVIIGLTFTEPKAPKIFDYPNPRAEPFVVAVKQINGYLIDGPFVTLPARTAAPPDLPRMIKGSQPTDGARLKVDGRYVTTSNLILDAGERDRALARDPGIVKWLRPFVGGEELISGNWRWCLWLKEASPKELRSSVEIRERLERVRIGRAQSPTESVRRYADYPTIFTQDRQPNESYVALPEVSSETRDYIPIDFLAPEVVASNKLQIVVGGTAYHLGVLTSWMHMAWMRTVTGRLKSDYSYSPTVYNTFPWPEASPAQRDKIEALAQAVLDARAAHPTSSLADLYDPDTMPANLRKAHAALDVAVDRLYRRAPFESDRDRVEHLFGLYEKLVNPLSGAEKANKRTARARQRKG